MQVTWPVLPWDLAEPVLAFRSQPWISSPEEYERVGQFLKYQLTHLLLWQTVAVGESREHAAASSCSPGPCIQDLWEPLPFQTHTHTHTKENHVILVVSLTRFYYDYEKHRSLHLGKLEPLQSHTQKGIKFLHDIVVLLVKRKGIFFDKL